jgi:hypothetical protein
VVVLTLTAMEHVLAHGRPFTPGDILAVVEGPEDVVPDPHRSGRRERFYGRHGPNGKWIRVVVDWSDDTGAVVTAHFDRRYRHRRR